MSQVSLYNQEGKAVGTTELSDAVFAVKPKKSLIHQVYVALMANAREPWAHTKDRGDVRGGGKKPWKQKGTGRARHGSSRSPIWKGGGVTFGPLSERNYTQKINKKMKKKAVQMCLTAKVMEERFIALDSLESTGKTKQIAALRAALPGKGKTTLIVMPEKHDAMLRATKNIPHVDVVRASDVNVVDLLHHQYVIASKATITALEKRLA